MHKKDAIKKLAAKNPKVNLAQLLESLRMTSKIRRIGIAGPGYRLVPPYAGGRVHIVDDAESDPRTIKLQHRQ
jgi:hypothetical protein